MKAILFLFLILCSLPAATQEPSAEGTATEEAAPTTDVTPEPQAQEASPPITTTPEAQPEENSAAPDLLTEAEVAEATSSLFSAINNKNWTLAFAFGVMILVYLVRKLGLMTKVPSNALVWVSVGLGVLTCVSAAIIEGKDVPTALAQGAILGLSGAGMWNAGGKRLLGPITPPEPPAEATDKP